MPSPRSDKLRAYQREYQKKWRAENAESHKSSVRKWHENNPGIGNELTKVWRANNREHRREYGRKWLRADREKKAGRPMPEACEVCGASGVKICFDHCHKSGEFRGWICDHCNKVLGLAKDNPEVLELLAAYLRRS